MISGQRHQVSQADQAHAHIEVLAAALESYRTNSDPETYPAALFQEQRSLSAAAFINDRIPAFLLQDIGSEEQHGYRFVYRPQSPLSVVENGESFTVYRQYRLTATPLIASENKPVFALDQRGRISRQ